MSQKHFKDDPNIGKRFIIEGDVWEVSDVWIDIGSDDDAPRHVTLDREDGEEDGYSLPLSSLASFTPA